MSHVRRDNRWILCPESQRPFLPEDTAAGGGSARGQRIGRSNNLSRVWGAHRASVARIRPSESIASHARAADININSTPTLPIST